MSLVDVELGEVIVGKLDLGAVHDLKAHSDEDILYLVEDIVHGVLVAESLFLAGERHVHRLVLKLFFHESRGEGGLALVDGGLYLAAYLVRELAHDGALLRGELAHLAQDGGKFALFAEIFDSLRLKKLNAARLVDGLYRGLPQFLHQFLHFVSPYGFIFFDNTSAPGGSGKRKKPPSP